MRQFYLVLAALFAGFWIAPVAHAGDQSTALREEGAQIYGRYCAGCHGIKGDSKGPAAEMLIVKPRDFGRGIFKFRSTPTGTLPTDEDLYKVITRGLYRTSMPEWGLLSERERLAVISYLKTFYPEWNQRGAGTPIYVPNAPASLGTPEAVQRGHELYTMLGCDGCHGAQGRGDGTSAADLPLDVWGNKQRPFNFTKGRLKSGSRPQDIYRTFMTGLDGTAMPSFADIFGEPDGDSIREGDAWNLVSFVQSLRTAAVANAGSQN